VNRALACAAIGLLAGCGSGSGGGGGSFAVSSTIFGYDPFTGGFDASGQQGEAPLIPMNMSVVFDFTDSINPATANGGAILVQELDTSVNPPAPLQSAAVTYQVNGQRLTISPLITFSNSNVTYGWGDPDPTVAPKTYQILFQVAPATTVLTSTHGKQIGARDRGPYLFRTSSQIFDQVPGAPVPSLRLLDPVTKVPLASLVNVPTDPVSLVEITFSEAVLPQTVLDPSGNGTSPNIKIEIDRDGNLATDNSTTPGDRLLLPGTYSLSSTSVNSVVLWTSLLTMLPTEPVSLPNPAGGCLYVVTVDGLVGDLSGNTKKSVPPSNPAAKDVFWFRTAPGSATTPVDPVAETFDTQTNSDLTVTSARWGTLFSGFLTPGIGGGTGTDGAFDPTDPAFQAAPPAGITLNVPSRLVTMSTETNPTTQRRYEFTGFKVPANWNVVASGRFPLSIQVSGNVTVTGTINVSGAPGAVYVAGSITPGAAGAAAAGGAAGGKGGATTDSAGASTYFPTKGGAPFGYTRIGFFTTAVANQGLSGRNTAMDTTAFTLTDASMAAFLNPLVTTNLWLQPNVGADDYRFERTHPSFKVNSIAAGMITVESNPANANYRGELSQETDNPWVESDGAGGIHAPLLAQAFDSYVIGELFGFPGSELFDVALDGTADETVKAHAGTGSEAQAVMQTFLTLGRAGGGGGGGSVAAGSNGADDPTVANGPSGFGGTGNPGAAGGVAGPSALLSQRVNATVLRVSTPLFDDGAGLPDASFVGHLVNPNVAQGNTFRIAAVDPLNTGALDTISITPITLLDGTILNLLNTVMPAGSTVRITPPYEVGGTGGGGAGVHCGGSSKTPSGHTGDPPLLAVAGYLSQDNLNVSRLGIYDDDNLGTAVQDGLEDYSESIFTLPRWAPGGGGGAGGGALHIVAAGSIDIQAAAQILAQGGEGGRCDLAGIASASGGGGGAGGTIFLGAGGTLTVASGGKISSAGGLGGAQNFGNKGGDGAHGRLRFENALGNLVPSNFTGATTPTVTAENLGKFPGGGNSIAQSIFVPIGALKPVYTKVLVFYTASVNGGAPTLCQFTVNGDGTIDVPNTTINPPPFSLLVSTAPANSTTGFVDSASATPFANPTTTPLSPGSDGDGYFRFKFILNDASTVFLDVPSGDTYADVRIDEIEFQADSVKP
jgi:hypothetical protein